MRLLVLPTLLSVLFYSGLLAQTQQETKLQPMSWNTGAPSTYEPHRLKNIYRFSEFMEGEVTLQGGDTSSGKFNFSVSWNQMHFIGEKDDTFYIAEPVAIKFIKLGNSRFYFYDDYYLETLYIGDRIMLAFRQSFMVTTPPPSRAGVQKIYPQLEYFNYYSPDGRQYKLTDDKKAPLWPLEFYYFGDKYGNFFPATKKYIYSHYPKYQAEIRSYIKTNHILFNNPEDLKKLLRYCSTLGLTVPV